MLGPSVLLTISSGNELGLYLITVWSLLHICEKAKKGQKLMPEEEEEGVHASVSLVLLLVPFQELGIENHS